MAKKSKKIPYVSPELVFKNIARQLDATKNTKGVWKRWSKNLEKSVPTLKRELRRERARWASSDPRHDRRRVFNETQEMELLGFLKAMASGNTPVHVVEFHQLVAGMRRAKSFHLERWFREFMHRYKSVLTVRKDKTINLARMSHSHKNNVEQFIAGYERLQEMHPVQPKGKMSLDEFVYSLRPGSKGAEVIEWRRRGAKNKRSPRAKKLGSCCVVTSATGTVVLKLFVLVPLNDEVVTLPKPKRYARAACANCYYMTRKSGLMDSDIFEWVAKKLVELKRTGADGIGPDLDRHLRLDNVSVHLRVKALKTLFDAKIYPSLLPPNTTAFSAVEDNLVFACLRNSFNQNVEWPLAQVRSREEELSVMWQAVEHAELDAFNKKKIVKSYENVGFEPYDPEILRRLAKRHSGQSLVKAKNENQEIISAARMAQNVVKARQAVVERITARGALANKWARPMEDVIQEETAKEEEKKKKPKRKFKTDLQREVEKRQKLAKQRDRADKKAESEALAEKKREVTRVLKEERDAAMTQKERKKVNNYAYLHCRFCGRKYSEKDPDESWLCCDDCWFFNVCAVHDIAPAMIENHKRIEHQ